MALEEVLAVVNFFVASSVELVAAVGLLIMMMAGLELKALLLLLLVGLELMALLLLLVVGLELMVLLLLLVGLDLKML